MDLGFLTSKGQASTLLTRFIRHKRDAYAEPSRKDTPRGEKVGLSKVKYTACLLTLTNAPQKVIAEKSGVSYGLLRVWKTEEDFKDMQRKLCSEFAFMFWDVIVKETAQLRKCERVHKGALAAADLMSTLKSLEIVASATTDMKYFGQLLVNTVESVYRRYYQEKQKLDIGQMLNYSNQAANRIVRANAGVVREIIQKKISALFDDLSHGNVTKILELLIELE